MGSPPLPVPNPTVAGAGAGAGTGASGIASVEDVIPLLRVELVARVIPAAASGPAAAASASAVGAGAGAAAAVVVVELSPSLAELESAFLGVVDAAEETVRGFESWARQYATLLDWEGVDSLRRGSSERGGPSGSNHGRNRSRLKLKPGTTQALAALVEHALLCPVGESTHSVSVLHRGSHTDDGSMPASQSQPSSSSSSSSPSSPSPEPCIEHVDRALGAAREELRGLLRRAYMAGPAGPTALAAEYQTIAAAVLAIDTHKYVEHFARAGGGGGGEAEVQQQQQQQHGGGGGGGAGVTHTVGIDDGAVRNSNDVPPVPVPVTPPSASDWSARVRAFDRVASAVHEVNGANGASEFAMGLVRVDARMLKDRVKSTRNRVL